MKYLYTNNATQGYKAGRQFYDFKAIQTLTGWVGVYMCDDELANQLLEHEQVHEIDQELYNNLLKKKNLTKDPNRVEIQVSLDSTKPIHAQERSVESVEVEAIEIRDVKPKAKKVSKKK